MKMFDRLSKGWSLGKTSLETIKDNPDLIIFPLISGASLVILLTVFLGGGYFIYGDQMIAFLDESEGAVALNSITYFAAFMFYLVMNFVIVFFNVGLIYCTRKVLDGQETNFREGVSFAMTRLNAIFSWAVLAATVGMILRAIEERVGVLGNIVTGLIGMVWGIATFFVIPVIASENLGPIQALKKSALVMKEKWGESLGATFSFGVFSLIGIFFVALPFGFLTGFLIHPIAGIITGILIFILVQTAVSAATMVFVAAAYKHVHDEPIGNFDTNVLDDLFINKK